MKLSNHQGMTLVEVIVSVGILVVALTMFAAIIGGAGNIMSRGSDLDRGGSASAEALEIFEDTDLITPQAGIVGISDGAGNTKEIAGNYQSVTVNDVTFTIFVPN